MINLTGLFRGLRNENIAFFKEFGFELLKLVDAFFNDWGLGLVGGAGLWR